MHFQGLIATSGATLANLQADLIGILTGSITSTAGLSSNFQPGASFINTVAPGWYLYDAAAGAAANGVTPRVIRSQYSDDPTKYKNVMLLSLSATQLGFNGYETWNSDTHTGTNPMQVTPVAGGFQSLTLTAGMMVVVNASANHIYIQVGTNLTAASTGYIYITEYTRDDPWNTVGNGYPSWLQNGAAGVVGNTAMCRYYDPATGTDKLSMGLAPTSPSWVVSAVLTPSIGVFAGTMPSQSGGGMIIGGIVSGIAIASTNTIGADASKAATKYLFDITFRVATQTYFPTAGAFLGGNCSAVAPNVMIAPTNASAAGDTMTIGSDVYQIVSNGAAHVALKTA